MIFFPPVPSVSSPSPVPASPLTYPSPPTHSGSHPRADRTRCCEILNRRGPTRCLLGQKTLKEQSEGWKHSVARDVRRDLSTKRHDALGKFFTSCLLQLMTCCLAEEPPALCAEDCISVRPIAPVACLKSSLADLQKRPLACLIPHGRAAFLVLPRTPLLHKSKAFIICAQKSS